LAGFEVTLYGRFWVIPEGGFESRLPLHTKEDTVPVVQLVEEVVPTWIDEDRRDFGRTTVEVCGTQNDDCGDRLSG
jgi:hypothetical protein